MRQAGIAFAHQLHPGFAVDVCKRLGAAEFQQAGRDIDGERLLLDHFAVGQPGVAHKQRNAQARLVRGAFIHHAVFAFEQAVVAHEDDDGVVELLGLLEVGEQPADAVVDAQDRAPVAVDHVLEILHGLGAVVGEFFAPLEERAVDAVPGVEALS